MERRLTAILAADVVGYSRLIRTDEEGTIAALKALRVDLIDPKLGEHNGRIVKLMGDGMLGNLPEARAAYEQFNRLAPGVTIETTLRAVPFTSSADAERYADGLRKAGMPE